MMYIIFSFSAQTGEVSGNLSYKISYQIVETKNELLNTGKSYEELAYEAEQIHYYVRKAAHMTEYCLLAVAVSFPFYVYRIRGLRLFLLAGIICVGFAGLDEYHQSFVAGRSPGIRDVGFDSLGALIGMRVCHHKTLHRSFRYGIPAILLVEAVGLFYLWWRFAA